jgi:hypothetical protein
LKTTRGNENPASNPAIFIYARSNHPTSSIHRTIAATLCVGSLHHQTAGNDGIPRSGPYFWGHLWVPRASKKDKTRSTLILLVRSSSFPFQLGSGALIFSPRRALSISSACRLGAISLQV